MIYPSYTLQHSGEVTVQALAVRADTYAAAGLTMFGLALADVGVIVTIVAGIFGVAASIVSMWYHWKRAQREKREAQRREERAK